MIVRPYFRHFQQFTVLPFRARPSSVAVCVSPTPPAATASAWRKPGSGVRYLLEEIDNRKRLHSALGYRSGESTRLCVRRLQRRSIPTDSPVHPQGVTESSLRDRPVRHDDEPLHKHAGKEGPDLRQEAGPVFFSRDVTRSIAKRSSSRSIGLRMTGIEPRPARWSGGAAVTAMTGIEASAGSLCWRR